MLRITFIVDYYWMTDATVDEMVKFHKELLERQGCYEFNAILEYDEETSQHLMTVYGLR